MGLASILKIILDYPTKSSFSSSPSSPSSWAWRPLCIHPRTLSFRPGSDQSARLPHLPPSAVEDQVLDKEEEEEDERIFNRGGCSTVHELIHLDETDHVIHGLRSDRLFFEPGGETSSILEDSSKLATTVVKGENVVLPFKEAVAEELESENPYIDFKVSMEKMVIAHGLKDLDFLEELLQWYLKMNGKETHGFIVGAFMDLLLDLAEITASPTFTSCFFCQINRYAVRCERK